MTGEDHKGGEGHNPSSLFFSHLNGLFDNMAGTEEASEETVDALIGSIKNVLSRRFDDDRHRLVNTHDKRINFSCPYCGDSLTDANKKRGNIYTETMTYHCFNCGHHTTVLRFLREFNEESNLKPNMIVQLRPKFKTTGYSGSDLAGLESVLGDDLAAFLIPREDIFKHYRLVEVVDASINDELRRRHQYDAFRFGWNAWRKQLFVFNMNTRTNGVLSFQIRNYGDNYSSKYLTYTHSRIREDMGLEPIANADMLNKLSKSFRIMEVSFSRSVTVFEGPLDAFLMKNAIALCSVKNDVPFPCSNYRFMYDYDDAGRKKAMQQVLKGESVFMWEKFIKEQKVEWPTDKKLDYNDLLIYYRERGLEMPSLDPYFLTNKFDMIWL